MDHKKQKPAAASAADVTYVATNAGKNASKLLIQLFYPTEKMYSELTGKFPVQSDRGNNYILVDYQYDANDILATPLKNRTGPYILNGITKFHDKLRRQGLAPELHIMDNEVSEYLNQ